MEDSFNLSLDFANVHLIHSEEGIYVHTYIGSYQVFYIKKEFIEFTYFLNTRQQETC